MDDENDPYRKCFSPYSMIRQWREREYAATIVCERRDWAHPIEEFMRPFVHTANVFVNKRSVSLEHWKRRKFKKKKHIDDEHRLPIYFGIAMCTRKQVYCRNVRISTLAYFPPPFSSPLFAEYILKSLHILEVPVCNEQVEITSILKTTQIGRHLKWFIVRTIYYFRVFQNIRKKFHSEAIIVSVRYTSFFVLFILHFLISIVQFLVCVFK